MENGGAARLTGRYTFAIALIGAVLIAGPTFVAGERSFDPTSIYQRESIQGFTVLVNPAVLPP